MRDLGDGGGILNRSEEIRRLNQDAGRVRGDGFFQLLQIQAAVVFERCRGERQVLVMRISGEHLAIFRMHAARNDHRTPAGQTHRHHHGLGGGGRTVIHGSVGNFHAGEFANHGLEFEDRLQRALRNLRLIGRVGGQKLAARNQRINDDRAVVGVGAGAKESGVAVAVFAGALAKPVHDLGFGHLARYFEIPFQPVFRGDGREQIIDRARAHGLQHGFSVGGRFG